MKACPALQIKRHVVGSGWRPVADPLICAGVEYIQFLDLRDVSFVFQKVIEERQLESFAIVDAGLAAEVSRASQSPSDRAQPP